MAETEAKPRITHIGNVMVPVQDQDKAIEFYVDKLGFEKRTDTSYGEGQRWVEVGPPGAETTVALVPPPEHGSGGGAGTIGFTSEDVDADHAVLSERGVDVDEEVMRMGDPVPAMFWFNDLDGNRLLIV